MIKAKKTALLISLGLILSGLIIAFIAAACLGFDPQRLNTSTFETYEQSVDGAFTDLRIRTVNSDIQLLPYDGGRCRVVYDESEHTKVDIQSDGTTLSITERDTRLWYQQIQFMYFARDPAITVYLPRESYHSLHLESTNGDMEVGDTFRFTDAELQNTNGEIVFSAGTSGKLTLGAINGSIRAANASGGPVKAKSVNGSIALQDMDVTQLETDTTNADIRLSDITAGELSAASTNGRLRLSQTAAEGTMKLHTVNADITLDQVDAASLDITTTNGDVSGSLLSPKVFDCSTNHGDVSLPPSDPTGGTCRVKTANGDVKLFIDRSNG